MGIVAKWETLEGEALQDVRAMLVKRVQNPPFAMDKALVRRGPLPFYDKRSLYEVTERVGGTLYYVVWDGGTDVVTLDYRSAPIHMLNERVPVKLRVPEDRQAELRLQMDYLRFFCGMLASETRDRFLLVESVEEIPWRVRDDRPDDLKIEPIRLDRVDEYGHSRFLASMLYMGSLFIVELRLNPNTGMVQMEADSPDRTGLDLANDFKAPAPLNIPLTVRRINAAAFLEEARKGPVRGPAIVFEPITLARGKDVDFPIIAVNVVFEWPVDLSNARLGSSFELRGGELQQGLLAVDARIAGSFTLNGVRVLGASEPDDNGTFYSIYLERAHVQGDLQLRGVTCTGHVSVGHGVIEGGIEVDNCQCPQGLWLLDIRVGANVSVTHTSMTAPKQSQVVPALSLLRARVGGQVYLSGLTLHGNLDASGSRIEQRLVWAGDTAKPETVTTIEGDVDISYANVGGLELAMGEGVLIRRSLVLAGVNARSRVAIWCTVNTMDLHDAKVEGDLDLSGLTVKGDLDLRDVNVQSCLSLVDRKRKVKAQLGGRLDMTGLTTRHLVMGQECFVKNEGATPASPPAQTQDARVVLDHANITLVELTSTPLVKDDTIDLRNVKVGTWDFVDKHGADERLEVFRQMLHADKHKAPSTYASIERSLFEQGFRDQAEEVRREMHRATLAREKRSGPPADAWWLRRALHTSVIVPLRLAKHWFWSWFGYGRAFVLGVAFLVFLIMGIGVFSASDSVTPAPGVAMPVTGTSPPPADWEFLDPLWMAVRVQVPMLSVVLMDQWRPSEVRSLGFGPVRFSPQDYAHFVSLGSWFWWAFFLLSVTGVVKRAGLRD